MILLTLVLVPVLCSAAAQPAVSSAPRVRLLDLTGDGLPDRIAFGSGGGLEVAVNQGGGRFAAVPQALPDVRVTSLLADDLDGDGFTDLYVVSPDADVALLGDGTGRLVDATERLGFDDVEPGVSAERVDLDGVVPADLLLHDRDGDVIYWARDGVFVRDAATPPGRPAAGGTQSDSCCVSAEQLDILNHMSMIDLDDGFGNLRRTIRITGVNVQIVNGTGATNGYPTDPFTTDPALTTTNGLGNLIVGYDDIAGGATPPRNGSHMIVLGLRNSYSAYGGFIAGANNIASGPYASTLGGSANTASGLEACIVGGNLNLASERDTAILGGQAGHATGIFASIDGGQSNVASGGWSWVGGGTGNTASGNVASVSGGKFNIAAGQWASILGGMQNRVNGDEATISGGESNSASGIAASVSGGASRGVSGVDDWAAGALFQNN